MIMYCFYPVKKKKKYIYTIQRAGHVSGINFIRYALSQKIKLHQIRSVKRLNFIRYALSQKIKLHQIRSVKRLNFIRYAQSKK